MERSVIMKNWKYNKKGEKTASWYMVLWGIAQGDAITPDLEQMGFDAEDWAMIQACKDEIAGRMAVVC